VLISMSSIKTLFLLFAVTIVFGFRIGSATTGDEEGKTRIAIKPHGQGTRARPIDCVLDNSNGQTVLTLECGESSRLQIVLSGSDTDSQRREVGTQFGQPDVRVETGDEVHRVFARSPSELEWTIELPHAPASNTLKFPIRVTGLEVFCQGRLSDSELQDGNERPDSVVGSWAVYEERNGADWGRHRKLFHIYRPLAWDAGHDSILCSLDINIVSGLLSIEIPQEFLAHAEYPITIDPTIGNTGTGATDYTFYSRCLGNLAGTYVASDGDRIESFHLYCRSDGDTARFEVAAYEVSGGYFGSRVGATYDLLFQSSQFAWREIPVDIELESGVEYSLACAEVSGAITVRRDDFASGMTRMDACGNLPSVWSEDSRKDYYLSFYATVVSGGSTEDARPRRRRVLISGGEI